MFKYAEIQRIKFSKFLQMCENTCFFPLLSRYFRACEIDPLMHNECLVCTCFQALVVWRFCMCTCLYPKHSFQHKHFAWLKVNSYKSKQGPGKSLKSPRTFRLKKMYEPTLSRTFHVYSIAANHMYNCQQEQYENFNSDFFLPSNGKVFISGEIFSIHTFPLLEIFRQLLLPLSSIKFSMYVMVNLIQILQLTYYHLIQAHNLPFSFTINYML